jgi:hypothetical protein
VYGETRWSIPKNTINRGVQYIGKYQRISFGGGGGRKFKQREPEKDKIWKKRKGKK